MKADQSLDCIGLYCPIPIVKTAAKIKQLKLGEVLEIVADDKGIKQDMPAKEYVTAVLCLGLFTSARVAEQVRAGVQSLPRGQHMASLAIGFTLPQTYRYVILPMAFRIIVPPLTSEFMNIFKNSSVAFAIGVDVDVDLDELDPGVVEVVGDPLRGDENVFCCHCSLPLAD